MVNGIRWQSCPHAVLTRAHNWQSESGFEYPPTCHAWRVWHRLLIMPASGLVQPGWMALALERHPLNLWISSGHRGLALDQSQPFGAGVAAAPSRLALGPSLCSGVASEWSAVAERKSPFSLCIWELSCPGFQQLFEFWDPNLSLTAVPSLPYTFKNWI